MLIKYLIRHFYFTSFRQAVIIFPLLLIGNICAVLLLNYFFKVNFPEDRTGYYFYYFFLGSIFYLTDKFAESQYNKRIAWITIPLLLIPVHFVYASNLTHIAVYREDRVPYRFYKELREKSDAMHEVATLGSYRARILVLAYQNYVDKGNVALTHSTDYPSLVPDFQIVKTDEYASWNFYYNAIDFDKVSGYHLLERKHKLKRHIISEIDTISTHGEISNEFFNLAGGTIDTLIQNPLFFEYTMDIESPVTPFVAWIVVGVADSAGKATAYEYIPFNWFKPEWKGKTNHFHNGQLVTNLPAGTQKYLTYIWNLNKVPFSILKANVTVKRLDKDY